MGNVMDWKAAMSSEIFREFVKNELQKEASEARDSVTIEANKEKVMDGFLEFQDRVQSNPKLKRAFSAWQKRFASDSEYRSKFNPDFVNGVMALFLDDEDE
jgi:hypothetical protein